MITFIFVITILTWMINMLIRRHRKFRVREQIGLSGPPASYLDGNLSYAATFIKEKGLDATPFIYSNLEKTYGSTYGFYFGTNLDIVTTDPAIIKEVFITKFSNFNARKASKFPMNVYPFAEGLAQVDNKGTHGAGWKAIRSVVSAIFSSAKMKKMHLLIQGQVEDLISELRAKSRVNDGKMDIYAEYQAISMDVIVKCALGQDISCVKDRSNDYYLRACKFVSNASIEKSLLVRLTFFFPMLKYFRRYTVFGREERILVDKLSESVRDRVKERSKGVLRPLPDLIDLILAENEKRLENGDKPLHHDTIVSNAWSFLLAGYETTSTAMTFTSYLLAKHPEAQQTLYEEITSVFEDDERIDYERVMKLPYLHAVFSEALRMYPPVVSFTVRRCIKETVIGGRIRVPEGVNVVAPVHAVMWNEANYDRPRDFIPERFLGENKAVWSATYLPFGLGPRSCVGARFAEMEFKTVLAEVTRRFVTQLADPAQGDLKTMTGSFMLWPMGRKLFVKLAERK